MFDLIRQVSYAKFHSKKVASTKLVYIETQFQRKTIYDVTQRVEVFWNSTTNNFSNAPPLVISTLWLSAITLLNELSVILRQSNKHTLLQLLLSPTLSLGLVSLTPCISTRNETLSSIFKHACDLLGVQKTQTFLYKPQ